MWTSVKPESCLKPDDFGLFGNNILKTNNTGNAGRCHNTCYFSKIRQISCGFRVWDNNNKRKGKNFGTPSKHWEKMNHPRGFRPKTMIPIFGILQIKHTPSRNPKRHAKSAHQKPWSCSSRQNKHKNYCFSADYKANKLNYKNSNIYT